MKRDERAERLRAERKAASAPNRMVADFDDEPDVVTIAPKRLRRTPDLEKAPSR